MSRNATSTVPSDWRVAQEAIEYALAMPGAFSSLFRNHPHLHDPLSALVDSLEAIIDPGTAAVEPVGGGSDVRGEISKGNEEKEEGDISNSSCDFTTLPMHVVKELSVLRSKVLRLKGRYEPDVETTIEGNLNEAKGDCGAPPAEGKAPSPLRRGVSPAAEPAFDEPPSDAIERQQYFMEAIYDGNVQQVNAALEAGVSLVEKIDIARVRNGRTFKVKHFPLSGAAAECQVEIIKLLLEAGADVGQGRSDNGATALMAAAERGHVAAVDALIEAGADANQGKSDNGATALMAAARTGSAPVCASLLAAGADVNQKATGNGVNALVVAATSGAAAVVKLLLEAGANANQVMTSNGWTPLMFASKNGHGEVCQLLLAAGADVGIQSTRKWQEFPPGSTATSVAKTAELMFSFEGGTCTSRSTTSSTIV